MKLRVLQQTKLKLLTKLLKRSLKKQKQNVQLSLQTLNVKNLKKQATNQYQQLIIKGMLLITPQIKLLQELKTIKPIKRLHKLQMQKQNLRNSFQIQERKSQDFQHCLEQVLDYLLQLENENIDKIERALLPFLCCLG